MDPVAILAAALGAFGFGVAASMRPTDMPDRYGVSSPVLPVMVGLGVMAAVLVGGPPSCIAGRCYFDGVVPAMVIFVAVVSVPLYVGMYNRIAYWRNTRVRTDMPDMP